MHLSEDAMTNEELLFSVIIPCYNQAHYLTDSVQSILAQSYKQWELIIVNDGSADNTGLIADEFAECDERISVIHQANAGLAMARNNGYAKSAGTFILFLDADDKLRSNCLATFAKELSNGKDIAVSGYAYFNDTASLYKEVLPELNSNNMQQLLVRNIAPPVAFAMQRKALQATSLFDKKCVTAEDWDLWARFYKAGQNWLFVKEVLVDYRVVPNSMSRNALKMYEGFKQVAESNVLFDERIGVKSDTNRNYPEVNKAIGIQHSLAICLGLLVMQGKIAEARLLFEQETTSYQLNWSKENFEPMCSFLSFRYWVNRQELHQVLSQFQDSFSKFFDSIGLSSFGKKEAMIAVFHHHYKLDNINRFGFFGRFLNIKYR